MLASSLMLSISGSTAGACSLLVDTSGLAGPPLEADAGAMGDDARLLDRNANGDGPSDADADAGVRPDSSFGPPCLGAIDCRRMVFVTSAKYAPNFGGLSKGDAKCAERAAASALPSVRERKFAAWLSGDEPTNMPAASRVVHGTSDYVKVDGARVAPSFATLLGGNLGSPIDLDENGDVHPDDAVWTGTNANGASATNDCATWTSVASTASGMSGITSATDARWTASIKQNCASPAPQRLYCIEQ